MVLFYTISQGHVWADMLAHQNTKKTRWGINTNLNVWLTVAVDTI